jgi:hypothetical protein
VLAVGDLSTWCGEGLGSPPVETLFGRAHLSTAMGLRLADGREVVVEARPLEERLVGCLEVQRRMGQAGFPCPEVPAGPKPLDGRGPLRGQAVTAEALVPGGTVLPPRPDAPELFVGEASCGRHQVRGADDGVLRDPFPASGHFAWVTA